MKGQVKLMNHLPYVSALSKRQHLPGGDFPDQRANVDPVSATTVSFHAMVEVSKRTTTKSFFAEDL